MTVRSLIKTVTQALRTVRNPTSGIRRVLRQTMANALGSMGTTFHRAQAALVRAEVYAPASQARSDLLSILSDKAKRDLLERLDPFMQVPIELMTQAAIKETRKYFTVFKLDVKYAGTDRISQRYVSGYFDTRQSATEWFRELEPLITPASGEVSYDIIDYQLVGVKHNKYLAY